MGINYTTQDLSTEQASLIRQQFRFRQRKTPVFWVMGPTNCGKSTISNFLAISSKYEVLRVGKILRDESLKKNRYSKELADCIERGRPIKNKIVISLLSDIMKSLNDSVKGFILDGFPNSRAQAKAFENYICRPSLIIYLSLSLDTVLGRILSKNGDADLERERQRFIRLSKHCDSISDSFSSIIHKVICNYPVEETYFKLVTDLEITWGYKFDQLFNIK